ncbi:MAG: ABC transporter permease [Planctomycetota bacterium]|jgi:putative ABC transport system permease protein
MGKIFFLVRRSLARHALSTFITVCAVALASGLVMSVFTIEAQTRQAFAGGDSGFDAVLGARGSQLQLVLNAVFHLETSPGNIPWSLYKEVRKHPHVELAVPYAVGDNYHGFRIVGTTLEMFKRLETGKGARFELARGTEFFDPRRRQAVLGSYAADRTGLKVGDTFNPYHGLDFDEDLIHREDEYHVKAILAPTNSPADRVIWIPIEGIFRMTGHVLRGAGAEFDASRVKEIPEEHKEVSAVMLKFKAGSKMAGFRLDQDINRRGKVATLAWPIGRVMAELFDKLGWVSRILRLVAYLVVAVATGSILATIYNTMNERRREFAILRALGARRRTVFTAIVAEATAIATLGTAAGYIAYALILTGAAYVVRSQTGVVVEVLAFDPVLVLTPVGMILLGAVAGLLPARKAYATEVATNLAQHA